MSFEEDGFIVIEHGYIIYGQAVVDCLARRELSLRVHRSGLCLLLPDVVQLEQRGDKASRDIGAEGRELVLQRADVVQQAAQRERG